MLLSAFGQELPNTVAHETVYRMPLDVTFLGVNALVLVGWVGMVFLASWLTDRLLPTPAARAAVAGR